VGIGKINAPDSGFFPLVMGSLLIFFSLGTIFEEYFGRRIQSKAQILIGRRWGTVLSVLLSLVIYVLILDSLGFIMATFLLMTFQFKITKDTGWKIALGASVLTTASAYLLFAYLLKCSLPRGFLGF
jgi:putative tricarboxylic transport membrane protein